MVGRVTLRHRFLSVLIATFLLIALISPSIAFGEGNQWASNGPSGAYVRSVALSPNYVNDATLFVAAWGGGVLKSTDGGASWLPVGFSGANPNTLALSPNYATDATLFAGLWDGVFKSTDGGTSWVPANSGAGGLNTNSIALSPNYPTDATLFAGTDHGVGKSTDGGASWLQVDSGLANLKVSSVALSPNYQTDTTLFAGTKGGGVCKSTDGGASWLPVNAGLAHTYVDSVALSPNYATDTTLFAGTRGGLCKSTDGGASWVKVGLPSSFAYSVALSSNYAIDATLFAGTENGVYESTDGSTSWNQVGLPSATVLSIAQSPGFATDGMLFAGVYGGGVYSCSLDVAPPTTTLSANPSVPDGQNGWFVSPATAVLASNEPGSTYYQWDTDAGSWSIYGGPLDVPEGVHTLYYYSVDGVGNKEATRVTPIKRDATAPVLAVPDNMTIEATGPDGARANFEATATDNLSVPGIAYSKDPGSLFPLGETTVTATATDEAGNTTTKSFTVRVQDTTAPTAPTSLKAIAKSTLLLFTKSVDLGWSGASDTVGVSSYVVQRSADGKTWSTLATVNAPIASYTDTDISTLTCYHYRVLAKDAAGNISTNPSPVASAMTLLVWK